jgi:hypothetical protein
MFLVSSYLSVCGRKMTFVYVTVVAFPRLIPRLSFWTRKYKHHSFLVLTSDPTACPTGTWTETGSFLSERSPPWTDNRSCYWRHTPLGGGGVHWFIFHITREIIRAEQCCASCRFNDRPQWNNRPSSTDVPHLYFFCWFVLSWVTMRGKSLFGKTLVTYSASSLTLTNQKVHYSNLRVRKWIRHEPDEYCAHSPLSCCRNA